MAKAKRKYGFPFTGYRADVSRDVAPLGAMTSESRDWLLSPTEGQLQLRGGMTLVGETITARTGLLETAWVGSGLGPSWAMCRHMIPVQYPYEDTVNSPTATTLPTALFTDFKELYRMGAILGVTKTNTPKVVGSDFSLSGAYDITANVEPKFKMVPLPCITRGGAAAGTTVSSGVLYNRCVIEYHRRLLASGARRMFQSGRWLFSPNFHGTPMKWDKRVNTGTMSERVRIHPWGNLPPLFAPTMRDDSYVGESTGNKVFYNYDAAFVTVMFELADGSFSMPYRANGSQLYTALVNRGAVGPTGTATFEKIIFRNIAIGPSDCVRRIILASDWVNIGTAAITASWNPPGGNATTGNNAYSVDTSIQNLKVVGILNNNTDTSFTLTSRNQGAQAATVIRDDHMWPPPSRYTFEMERRVGVGYSRRTNPCALVMAPLARRTGAVVTGADWQFNLSDESASLYTSYVQAVQLYRDSSGAMTLNTRQADIGVSTNTNTTETATSLSATSVLQDIIDTMYATTTNTNGGAWAAQLVPGVDGNILCSNLQPTVFQVGNITTVDTVGTIDTTATSPYDFSDVSIGMKVRITNGGGSSVGMTPTTAIVVQKVSNTRVILGQSPSGVGISAFTQANGSGCTFEFWSDTGDDTWNTHASWTTHFGNIRAFGPTLPMVLSFTGRYMDTIGVDRQRIVYTSATPGAASMAAQAFFNNKANIKSVPTTAGNFMGAHTLGQSVVLCYSRAIYVLANRKGGTSGEDFDYHIYPLNLRRGCTQFGTICGGDGWVSYRTTEGYVVTDGEREVIISNALYDPATKYGVIANMTSNYGDQDIAESQTDHSHVANGALHISYTTQNTGDAGARVRSVYSFAAGIEGSGLGEVLKNGNEPWGWSSPLQQKIHAMTSLPDGTLFGMHDKTGIGGADPYSISAAGATLNEGSLYKLDTPTTNTAGTTTVTQHMDSIVGWVVGGTISQSPKTFVVTTSADFPKIAIGALVTGSRITGTAIVTAKSQDGITLTLDGTITSGGLGTCTFYGFEVGYQLSNPLIPYAYLVNDSLDDISNYKSLQRIATRFSCSANTQIAINEDIEFQGSNGTTFRFTGQGGSGNGRFIPVNARAEAKPRGRRLGKTRSFAVVVPNPSNAGTDLSRPEVYGIEAEYEICNSPK